MKAGNGIELGRPWVALAVLVITLLAASLGPVAAANANTFTVDSTGDAPQHASGAVCETEAGNCTLRAAIEAANGRPGLDRINFDATVFTGAPSGTIEPTTSLPAIVDPLEIVDGCPSSEPTFPTGICAGLDATGLPTGFLVESDEVTIAGLAITGATIGIDVAGSGDEFAARRDRLGANLAGEPGPNGIGIRLGPGANDAQIGTYAVNGTAGGDTFVDNTEVGLDLEGASRAKIQGSVFGVLAGQAPNGTDIEISDVSTGGRVVKAVENEVGAKKSRFAELSAGCSESCNVISGAVSDGIDLEGDGGAELPATGPTVIRGNVIGASGSSLNEVAEPNGDTGIAVGSAREVIIGGPLPPSEGNRFVGGRWAVTAGPKEGELTIEGNVVGRSSGAYPHLLEPPTEGAFSLDTLEMAGVDSVPWIVDNDIVMDGGIGVLVASGGAEIVENGIYGTDTGVRVEGERMWHGVAVDANEMEFPGEYGVVLDNWQNWVRGNFIFGATKAGVRVESPGWTGGTEDYIGGIEVGLGGNEEEEESEEEENEIDDSGGPAIEILGEETAFVDVLRNFGKQNSGPFIDLGGDGPGNQGDGPNAGIQAPTILSATPEEVSGDGALRGGTRMRVFLKAGPSPGEIEEFLSAGFAAEDGTWSVELPEALPVGTSVGVTQTAERGTSEMSVGTVVAGPADSSPGGADGGSEETGDGDVGNSGSLNSGAHVRSETATPPAANPSAGPSSLAPTARIVAGPAASLRRPRATFRIAASPPAERLECSLDGSAFRPCHSPRAYSGLKPGHHLFRVRAVAAGLTGPAAKAKFTVKP